jgi:hypothetical protein
VIDGFATLVPDGAGVTVWVRAHAAKSRNAVQKEEAMVEVLVVTRVGKPEDGCSQSRASATP